MLQVFVIFSILLVVSGQRSPYAGSRPSGGYKDTYLTPVAGQNTQGTTNIVNRFDGTTQSSSGVPSTTQRLPYDAHGDQYIVNYWQSLPEDKRPFWLVNQAHIESQRGTPTTSTVAGRPSSSSSLPSSVLAGSLDNRVGETTFANTNSINGQTTPSQPEIVFPSNLTPEQRLQLEINLLQQRLQYLQDRQRQQQQAQNQQQSSQQIPLRPTQGRRF